MGGALFRDFSIVPLQVALTFVFGILSQAMFIRIFRIKNVGYLSAVITCFGISLLLRSNHIWVHPLAIFLAISSKFLIRFRGKHLLNPAMFAVLFAMNLLPASWISPGQWGYDLAVLFWLLIFGFIVTARSRTLWIGLSFIGFYFGLLAIRVLYLGYHWDVWFHQFKSGSLLLFSFFMITDPKTSPDHPSGRLIHTGIVALIAFIWQYYFYFYHNLLYALLFASPLVPLLDTYFKYEKFEWAGLVSDLTVHKGV